MLLRRIFQVVVCVSVCPREGRRVCVCVCGGGGGGEGG